MGLGVWGPRVQGLRGHLRFRVTQIVIYRVCGDYGAGPH